MDDMPQKHFNYLAFEQSSHRLLAYGPTVESAVRRANEISPASKIKVLSAGEFGRTIWNRRFPLLKAWNALILARVAVAAVTID